MYVWFLWCLVVWCATDQNAQSLDIGCTMVIFWANNMIFIIVSLLLSLERRWCVFCGFGYFPELWGDFLSNSRPATILLDLSSFCLNSPQFCTVGQAWQCVWLWSGKVSSEGTSSSVFGLQFSGGWPVRRKYRLYHWA